MNSAAPTVRLVDGAGGSAGRRLLERVILPALGSSGPATLSDAAAVAPPTSGELFVTCDSFVVQPRVFPGGCLGSLAVHGTVNDLAVAGARPFACTLGLVLAEGLELAELRFHLEAFAAAAGESGLRVAAGDTKVVEATAVDGCVVTVTGVGVAHPDARLEANLVEPGDLVVLSGPVADHGAAVLVARGGLRLQGDLRSDSRSVWPLVDGLLAAVGDGVRWMRDPTRGGLATICNELADVAGVGIAIDETAVPVRDVTRGTCELLGLDPLYVANEGCFVAVVAAGCADDAVAALRDRPGGELAAVVGTVERLDDLAFPRVVAQTPFGGTRVLGMLTGDPLPRIC